MALLTGFGFAKLWGLHKKDIIAITFETGIQNVGLGLMLIFQFFDGLGGMAIIAGMWGLWDMISGTMLSTYLSKKNMSYRLRELD